MEVVACPWLMDVAGFVERPVPSVAETSFRGGGLWSTMVVVAKLKTLWGLGWRFPPDVMPLFLELWDSTGTESEERVLDGIYQEMTGGVFLARVDGVETLGGDGARRPDAERLGRPSPITETLARRQARVRAACRPLEPMRREIRAVVAHARVGPAESWESSEPLLVAELGPRGTHR